MGDAFHDMIRRCDPYAVARAFSSAYEDTERPVVDLIQLLRTRAPKQSDDGPWTIVVKLITDSPFADEPYVDVGAENGDGKNYAIDFTPWDEWLSMSIRVVGQDMDEATVLAHCLWEMTWHGSEEDAAEVMDEAKHAVEEIKRALD